MEFRKYQHIERYGTREVDGIENGLCFVFYKIDGTNASAWTKDNKELGFGSRNRELSLDNDNAKFMNEMIVKENIKAFFVKYPHLRLYGEWLCLSGDTTIRMVSGGKRGHYMTLREMYKYSTTNIMEKSSHVKKNGKISETLRPPWWERYGYPSLFSLYTDEDKIKPQKMAKIIYTGDKDVYRLTTRMGKEIKSTMDHKFLTNSGWKALKDIKVGEVVGISDLMRKNEKRRYGKGQREILRMFDEMKNNNNCEECNTDKKLNIHHIDEDWKNNDKTNLQVLCEKCHYKKHKHFAGGHKGYDYYFDKVKSIEYVGVEDCYDISMDAPENSSSFVADNFIVHNCPHSLKTYSDDAWNKFYVFDVTMDKDELDENGKVIVEYLPYDTYSEMLKEFGIDFIPPLAIIKNGHYESFVKCLDKTGQFLIKDGAGKGEGIVIKNYDFYNKYGRQTWAKIVANEFKTIHHKEMGAPLVNATKLVEERIVEEFMTEAFIEKEYAKLVVKYDGWSSKYIGEFLGRTMDEFYKEEAYNFIKALKNPKINFKMVYALGINKIKITKQEIFR